MRAAGVVMIGLVTGCTGSTPDRPVDESELSACEPILQFTPSEAWAEPWGVAVLAPSGGTGSFVIRMQDDASGGAAVHGTTGSYVAGATSGVSDTLELTDDGCIGAATATVHVVDPLDVQPRTIRVAPGATVQLVRSGGSPDVSCEVVTGTGTVAAESCVYTAGSDEGVEIVRVSDARTGRAIDATITVAAGAGLQVHGAGRLFVPVGATAFPRVDGGSGRYALEWLSGPVQVEDGVLVATGPGRGQVRLRDEITGESVTIEAEGVQAFAPDEPRDGERLGGGIVLALGDINGDGFDDAALAWTEASVTAHNGGAVAVYHGSRDGLKPAPAQVFSSGTVGDSLGQGLDSADVNGDGRLDLIIGIDKLDRGSTNTGAVEIHMGLADGTFESEASVALNGQVTYSRLGSAVAACDFDGDGFVDLAAGALDDVDGNTADPAFDQGAIHVWRGSAGGYAARADFAMYGSLPDAGDWVPGPGMHLGTELAVGDLDGDGKCDLIAGAKDAYSDAGVVYVFGGTTDADLLLTREPIAWIRGASTSELGRRIAVGDVDQDGRDDVLIGAFEEDTVASNAGAAYLFAGPLTGELQRADARWRVHGQASSAYLGSDVDIADVTGSSAPDVIIGAYRWRADGGAYSEGVVLTFDGAKLVASEQADPLNTADAVADGLSAYDRFGQAAAGIGDVDDDGSPDLLVVAGRDSTLGIEVGAPYVVDGASGDLVLLDLPGEAAGHDWGRSVALFDMDGDGIRDVVIGSPGAGDPGEGANAGIVRVFAGTGDGFSTTAQDWLGGHATHSAGDLFGYDVASAGDFDGDGYEDLVVAARKDSRPSSWEGVANPDECSGSISLAGAAFVYRGGPGGIDDVPDFVVPGRASGEYLFLARPAGDVDGDGHDDLVLGSIGWTGAGGFAIVHGRPAASQTTVVCDQRRFTGESTFDRLGVSAVGLGDLDGDGCDEVAVGASREESHGDWFNQGMVRVLWGYGGPGCPAQPQITALSMKPVGSELGSSLSGGHDIDGDGIPDLLVGGEAWRNQFGEYGGAWFTGGSWLVGLDRQPLGDALPAVGRSDWENLVPLDGLEGDVHGLTGPASGSLFGAAVATVPVPDGNAYVAVGAPAWPTVDGGHGGGVSIHAYVRPDAGGTGLEEVPWAYLAGEADDGQLGAVLHGGVTESGVPILVVGAPRSSTAGLQVGAVYVLRLDR